MGFSGGVVRLSPEPAANSGTREDLSNFAPGSVAAWLPVCIPVGDLGDFLLFLYEDLNLAASTVHT